MASVSISKRIKRPRKASTTLNTSSSSLIGEVLSVVRFILLEIVKPVFVIMLTFFLLATVYEYRTGVGREVFRANQLEEVIRRSLPTPMTDFKIIDVDFHGFGIVSKVILIAASLPDHEGKKYETRYDEKFPVYSEIIVFDEVQPGPIEQMLFNEQLFREAYKFKLQVEDEEAIISNERVTKYRDKKQRFLFCLSSSNYLCGFIQYEETYHVRPLIQDGSNKQSLSIANAWDKALDRTASFTRFPTSYSVFEFKGEDEELYVGVPVEDPFRYEFSVPYQVCRYQPFGDFHVFIDADWPNCFKYELPQSDETINYRDSDEMFTRFSTSLDKFVGKIELEIDEPFTPTIPVLEYE